MAAAETLTAEDLAAGRFQAGDFAVLGDPIAHSLSPVMHQASLALLAPLNPALRGRRYHRIHIRPDELPKALEYFVRPMPQILKFAAVMQLHALMLRYARHATDRLGD